jgi:hypothetical protein
MTLLLAGTLAFGIWRARWSASRWCRFDDNYLEHLPFARVRLLLEHGLLPSQVVQVGQEHGLAQLALAQLALPQVSPEFVGQRVAWGLLLPSIVFHDL